MKKDIPWHEATLVNILRTQGNTKGKEYLRMHQEHLKPLHKLYTSILNSKKRHVNKPEDEKNLRKKIKHNRDLVEEVMIEYDLL